MRRFPGGSGYIVLPMKRDRQKVGATEPHIAGIVGKPRTAFLILKNTRNSTHIKYKKQISLF